MHSLLIALLETGLPVFLLVTIVELVWRKKKYHTEFTRKFVHMAAGTYAAFWPWFVGWRNIQLLALGGCAALILSRLFSFYKTMHLARRYGTGEILASLSLAVLPLITHNRWLFAAAVLNLSLADGLAAIAGTKFGKKNSYKIFGERRSAVGTLAFMLCSAAITAVYFWATKTNGLWLAAVLLPVACGFIENVGLKGTDNLLVPVVVAVVLKII